MSGDNFTGENISVRQALHITPIYISTMVRGNTIASLPINVIQEQGNNKVQLTDHPAYSLLSAEPNNYMTAANFWKTIMLHVDAWGNGYAYINRDSRNNPISLDIWEPWCVRHSFVDGKLFYSYKDSGWEPNRDVLHYRFYSLDGICGISPILENANTIGQALKLDRYQTAVTGARPPGILSYEGRLSPEQIAQNEIAWRDSSKQVKVLSGGWKYQPIMTDPQSVEFGQAKQAIYRDIYGIYQIPPTFAQNFERATYNNAEQSDLVYAKHTITPICRNIELENNMKLFFEKEKATTYTKFNMNGLLRGDLAARQSFYQSMVNGGMMLRNEVRALEDFNGYEGGDVPLIQGAMIPGDEEGIEALRKKMETEVIPSAAVTKVNGKHYVN